VELRRTDVAGIAHLLQLVKISSDEYYADYESNNSSHMGGSERKAPISVKQTEFLLKQFTKRMGSPTLVPSTTGRKCRWLGVWKRSIGPLFWDRAV